MIFENQIGTILDFIFIIITIVIEIIVHHYSVYLAVENL